jgi:glycosyltransferase involved in cell wall biosynthesis
MTSNPHMPRTLSVAQWADSYPPVINGVSSLVYEHHAELLARGVDAHVLTFGYVWHRRDDALRNVWRTPGVQLGASPFYANVWVTAQARLAAARAGIFHFHEPFGIAWLAGARLARRLHIPYVFTVHTRHDAYIKNWPQLMQPWLQQAARRVIAGFVRGSALTTAPSADTAAWLRAIAPQHANRIRVQHNGIQLAQFEPRMPSAEALGRFGVLAGRMRFIYAGRLTPEKNLHTLLTAFGAACAAGADVHLIVIGDGESREALEAHAQTIPGRVTFTGMLRRDALPAALALGDVFVTTSLHEAHPVSVVEALAMGLPYLAHDAPWWSEFMHTPPAGLLARDCADLTRLFVTVCHAPGLLADMRHAALALSRKFDIQSVSARWLALYEDALSQAHQARMR